MYIGYQLVHRADKSVIYRKPQSMRRSPPPVRVLSIPNSKLGAVLAR